jgi:hypothetical protein
MHVQIFQCPSGSTRGGMDYGRLTLFHWGGRNIPALHLGGGFDAYVTKHFGVETQVSVLHTLGNYGGDNAGFVTFGLVLPHAVTPRA